MSPDLERELRDARELLPEPDAAATRLARERALAAARTRRRRLPPALALAASLLVAVVAGITIGASTPQSVTAGRGPLGLGFLPLPGWYTLHAPGVARQGTQFASLAANVPFHATDDLNGLASPSGLPYATLLELPRDGVVLVAIVTERYEGELPPPAGLEQQLPLRLSAAEEFIPFSTQVRPKRPLGQAHLSAHVGRYDLTVNAYFGTPTPSSELLAEAQRQLDGLVVRPGLRLPEAGR